MRSRHPPKVDGIHEGFARAVGRESLDVGGEQFYQGATNEVGRDEAEWLCALVGETTLQQDAAPQEGREWAEDEASGLGARPEAQ